jgi:hypothetical protein
MLETSTDHPHLAFPVLEARFRSHFLLKSGLPCQFHLTKLDQNCFQAILVMPVPDAGNVGSLLTLALQSTHFQSFLSTSASSRGYSNFISTDIVSTSASIDVDTPHVCVECRHRFQASASSQGPPLGYNMVLHFRTKIPYKIRKLDGVRWQP